MEKPSFLDFFEAEQDSSILRFAPDFLCDPLQKGNGLKMSWTLVLGDFNINKKWSNKNSLTS